jgi:hypothetical protein
MSGVQPLRRGLDGSCSGSYSATVRASSSASVRRSAKIWRVRRRRFVCGQCRHRLASSSSPVSHSLISYVVVTAVCSSFIAIYFVVVRRLSHCVIVSVRVSRRLFCRQFIRRRRHFSSRVIIVSSCLCYCRVAFRSLFCVNLWLCCSVCLSWTHSSFIVGLSVCQSETLSETFNVIAASVGFL